MQKLINIIKKDMLLLIRDKLGLITLFVLPAFLVLVVSSIAAGQESARNNIAMLLISNGSDKTSSAVETALRKSDKFKITKYRASVALAKTRVNEGKYNGIIYIPLQDDNAKPYHVDMYLDPGLDNSIKSNIKLGLEYILNQVELTRANFILGKIKENLVQDSIELNTGSTSETEQDPSISEQNVPAWSIFGMFFIVISLAGQMVHEKIDGVHQRLHIMPVSSSLLLVGKTVTFVVLNLIQLMFMLSIGIFILPLLNAPMLIIGSKMPLVLLIGFCTSLAAIGFGILMGTLSRSISQVNSVCPFLIVIMAAVSGIFTPISLMPEQFKAVGSYSPLYWAQASFLDLFSRNATLNIIYPNLIKLAVFYVAMLVLVKIIKIGQSD